MKKSKGHQKDPTEKQPSIEDLILRLCRFYHIRMTSEKLTKSKTENLLKEFPYYIIASEGDGIQVRHHQHIMVGHNDLSKIDPKILRSLIKETYQLTGNSEYSIKVCKNKKQLATYSVKEDENPLYKGFTPGQIQTFQKRSYDKDKFQKEYQKLQEKLDDDELSLGIYSNHLFHLKAETGQPVCMRSHQNHILSKAIKKGLIETHDLTNEIFRRLGYDSTDSQIFF